MQYMSSNLTPETINQRTYLNDDRFKKSNSSSNNVYFNKTCKEGHLKKKFGKP